VHSQHPLAGLRLVNTTEVHWLQGPITLFDGGEYAGDARIADIPPGSTRLISYALDLQTEVDLESQDEESELIGLQIQAGGLKVTTRDTRDAIYVVKNSAAKPRKLLIERPLEGSWKPTSPEPVETTRSLRRYELEVAAGKSKRFTITEQQEQQAQYALVELSPSQISLYLNENVASAGLKQALQDAVERKTALIGLEGERADVERQIANIATDQARIRSNLQAVGSVPGNDPFAVPQPRISGELAQRYLTRLEQQETELESLRERLLALKEEEAQAKRKLEERLKNLTID
jgi:hypothetical protein